jgi:hypothetical protein
MLCCSVIHGYLNVGDGSDGYAAELNLFAECDLMQRGKRNQRLSPLEHHHAGEAERRNGGWFLFIGPTKRGRGQSGLTISGGPKD